MKSRKTNTDTSLEQHKRIQNKFKTHVKGRVLISISGDPFREYTWQLQPLPKWPRKILLKEVCSSESERFRSSPQMLF